MKRSKLDPTQIMQYEFDERSRAKKVKIIDTEMGIELDADDGDSVLARAESFEVRPSMDEEFDVSKWRKFVVYTKDDSFVLEVGVDDMWEILPVSPGKPCEVIAKKMRVNVSGCIIIGKGV
jgi:hypothetical protein